MARRRCSPLWIFGALGFAVAAVAVRIAGSPGAVAAVIPWRCPLRAMTGIECPTCGLGEALLALAAFDVRGAWAAHPAAVLLPIGAGKALAARRWWPESAAAVAQAFARRRVTAAVAVVAIIYAAARG